MNIWPPSSHPVVPGAENVGTAGNARHPTIAPGGPMARGRRIGRNIRTAVVQYAVPDPLAVSLAGSMAMATNTRSPMADGHNEFRGLAGYGVHRFAGRLDARAPQPQAFTTPISPIASPKSVRVGMQGGPSSSPAFPSTGGDSGFGALGMMNGGVTGWVS